MRKLQMPMSGLPSTRGDSSHCRRSTPLPDIVQLGGIYTPPAFRGRGYAKASVAASLLAARDRGATRAVLFTSNPSAARSYEAVGFQRLGDYGLILLS
jgi:predicted GNAT family acetyltransferase